MKNHLPSVTPPSRPATGLSPNTSTPANIRSPGNGFQEELVDAFVRWMISCPVH